MTISQKITPNLWFNANAKEAVDYYVSVFPHSKINSTSYYPNSMEEGLVNFQLDLAGKELAIDFELDGVAFIAINGDDTFKLSEAVSFAVTCKDQAEIDYYWEKLAKVPEAEQCGWCKDQFGLSWQIVPENMGELMKRPNAYSHMMDMHKLVIEDF
jgi:predicted 3-demethylubiquinone-9 3-methyltransferase (glyoxalase superfamily)